LSVTNLGSPFARLLAARSISSLGTGLHLLAVPLLATTLTSDPRVVAALAAASSVPSLLFALPVGAWVDRSHRGRLVVGSDLTCAAVLATLVALLLTGHLELWHLFALSAGLGVAELVFGTSSFALLPSLVRKTSLVEANGYLSTSSSLGAGIVGPNLGGLAYAVSPVLPFLANGLSYLLSSVLIGSFAWHKQAPDSTQPGTATRRQRATSYLREITAGVAFIKRHRSTRTLLVLSASSGAFGMMPEGTLVLYAKEELHLTDQGFGILLSVTTLGAVLGGLLSGRLFRRLGVRRLLVLTYATYGLLLIPPAFLTSGIAVCVLAFVQGIPIIACDSTTTSLRQTIVPDDLLGRVSSVFGIVGAVTVPSSLAVGGLLGHWIGLRPVWAIAGSGFVLVLLLELKGIRQISHDAATTTTPEADARTA
jgi:MFS family permease